MKKEIEEIIYMLNNNLKYWHQNLAGTKEQDFAHVEHLLNKSADKLISLFEKKIEECEEDIKEELVWQIDPIDTGKSIEQTTQDIINIIKKGINDE